MKTAYILLIALFYIIFFVTIPPFQLPDEPDHFQYVYWLSKGVYPRLPDKGGLKVYDKTIQNIYDIIEVASNDYNIPNFQKISRASRQYTPFLTTNQSPPITYQAHHPPLYHLSALLFFKPAYLISQGNLIITYYATKLISALYYALSIYFAWRIGTFLLKNRKVATYLVMVYAINPVTLKMGVSINPDIASTCVAMATLFIFLKLSKKISFSIKTILLLSLLLAISTLIKFQNISYVLFIFAFFIIRGFQLKKIWMFLRYFGILLFFFLLFISPWLWFSYTTYHTITPSYIAYRFFCTANLISIPWLKIPFEVLYEFRHAFFHFAGFLGWGEPYPFKPFFIVYAGGFILALLLGVRKIIQIKDKNWLLVLIHATSICLFFLGVSITYKTNRYSCDVQGRYLLSALFPFILIVWRGSNKEPIARYLFLFSIWQYLFILCYVLIPRYYV